MASPGIVFYGTPEFAVASLQALLDDHHSILAVVTAPDKPSGRGQKLQVSAVKEFALRHQLKILQPSNLKDESFLQQLRELNPELQVVVAFRMLPEAVWKFPGRGTFNLHASLLPQYRGAAPINWAIINGETETGVTTFFLRQEIDTGSILFQEKEPVLDTDTAGSLHDRLKMRGAQLVVKTAKAIFKNEFRLTDQESMMVGALKAAPKLTKQNTKIDFNQSPESIRNFVRGLNPYPGAHTGLMPADDGLIFMLKIFDVECQAGNHHDEPGTIRTDNKSYLKVCVPGGMVEIKTLQVAGRGRMNSRDFLNGFKMEGKWKMT